MRVVCIFGCAFRTKVLNTIVSGNIIAYTNNEIPEQPFGLELEFND